MKGLTVLLVQGSELFAHDLLPKCQRSLRSIGHSLQHAISEVTIY